MAKLHQRVIALTIAVLFFATAVGTGIGVILTAINDNKSAQSATDTSQQTQQNQTAQANKKLSDFTPVSSVSTLKATDTKKGTGAAITSVKQTVTVDYSGAVAKTGVIFDSSEGGQPLNIPLSNLIKGWQEGLVGMKVGGERRLLIPADLAYGANPPQGSGIPANAPLVFDITLKAVK